MIFTHAAGPLSFLKRYGQHRVPKARVGGGGGGGMGGGGEHERGVSACALGGFGDLPHENFVTNDD